MNSIFKRIYHGFLFGIGFSIIVGAIYYFLTTYLTKQAWDGISFDASDIQIISHKKIERNGKLLVLGQIKNVSESKIRGVVIQVDLYANEEFVKQCVTYIRGTIEAASERNFQLSCYDGKPGPIIEHDSYKIYVTS